MFALIFAFILFPQSHSTAAEQCTKKNPEKCVSLAVQARAKKNYTEAYKFAKMACDYDASTGCDQLYYIAKLISDEKALEAKKYLEKKCARNDFVCGSLASLYREEKEDEKALLYEKKYFLKYNEGLYPYNAYKAGKKDEAFEYALRSCQHKSDNCAFYIRYMPNHPQLEQFISKVESSCKENKSGSTGATDCAILGSYFYSINNHVKAIDLWSVECQESFAHDTACSLVIGSDADEKLKLNAFKIMCAAHVKEGFGDFPSLKSKYCNSISAGIPPEIQKASTDLLQSYLREQKPMPKN